MKLYYSKGACSLASRIIINELDLPCDYEAVDLRAKKTETGQDFYKINSKGAVPTLQTDTGEILTENAIIQQYLAEQSHAIQLLPPVGDFKRYRVLEWQNYVASDLHKGVGSLFNPGFTQEIKDGVIVPMVKTKMTYVNERLKGKHYLLGEQFTLPDAYLFIILRWVAYFKLDMMQWPDLARYFEELKKRPSVAKSLQQEGL
jgi:glutathione S-transferase